MKKFSAATQAAINESVEKLILGYDCEEYTNGAEIERMYLRLRSRNERINRTISVLSDDIRYNTELNYTTQTSHKSYGRDYRYIMLTDILLNDEIVTNQRSVTEYDNFFDNWANVITRVNELHENILCKIFIDPEDVSRYVLHIQDCIYELEIALVEKAALTIVFSSVAELWAVVMRNIRENDDETINGPIETNLRQVIQNISACSSEIFSQ